MDVLKINGAIPNVKIMSIDESFTILYSQNTGRTLASGAKMTLDPLGTFYTHRVTVKRIKGHEIDFDQLYNLVANPRYDGLPVEVVHNQSTMSYTAYFSEGGRKLKYIDKNTGKPVWDEFEFEMIPMEAQVLPV